MGMFATINIHESVDLPELPGVFSPDELWWQSKQGIDLYNGPYRITEDYSFERKEQDIREKTDGEKLSEAEQYGYNSWGEYVSAYEECDYLYPEQVTENRNDDHVPPVAYPTTKIVDDNYYVEHNVTTTIEFHSMIQRNPIEYERIGNKRIPKRYELEMFLSYEATIDSGDVTDIRFCGRRGDDNE